jgi:hypothetical protein
VDKTTCYLVNTLPGLLDNTLSCWQQCSPRLLDAAAAAAAAAAPLLVQQFHLIVTVYEKVLSKHSGMLCEWQRISSGLYDCDCPLWGHSLDTYVANTEWAITAAPSCCLLFWGCSALCFQTCDLIYRIQVNARYIFTPL